MCYTSVPFCTWRFSQELRTTAGLPPWNMHAGTWEALIVIALQKSQLGSGFTYMYAVYMQCIYIYVCMYVCIYIYAYIYIYIIDIYYYILWIGRPTMVGICNSWEKGNVHADEPPIVIAKPPEVTPKGHTYGFPMLAPSLFSCLALCVHQNPLVGFWVETVHGRHRLMSCDPLADMVKTGQDTRLAEPLVECDHIFENSQYMYIYIYTYVYEPGPGSPLSLPPPPNCMVPPTSLNLSFARYLQRLRATTSSLDPV